MHTPFLGFIYLILLQNIYTKFVSHADIFAITIYSVKYCCEIITVLNDKKHRTVMDFKNAILMCTSDKYAFSVIYIPADMVAVLYVTFVREA